MSLISENIIKMKDELVKLYTGKSHIQEILPRYKTDFLPIDETHLSLLHQFMENNPRVGLIRAELWFCIHNELCACPEDFFMRRTGRLYFNIESVTKYLDFIIADFAEHFDWSIEQMEEEKEKVIKMVENVSKFEYTPKAKDDLAFEPSESKRND